MSCQEYKLRKLLEDSVFYIQNATEDETLIQKCKIAMDEAQNMILNDPPYSFKHISNEAIVIFVEVALQSGTRDLGASLVLDKYFERIHLLDQFYCRALFAKSTVEERKVKQLFLKGDANLKQIIHAFSFIRKAIEIAAKPENKIKYAFLIYNASIKSWHIIRNLMRPGWANALIEILERISNLLEELDDFDVDWRYRYMSFLIRAMIDGEKKPEALKILDKLVDISKKRGGCEFQELLFRNRIHNYRDNNAMIQNIKKETETGEDPLGLKQLFVIQSIKSGVIPDGQIEKELQVVMTSIAPQSVSSVNDNATSNKIPQIQIDRLAECGRIAIKYGIFTYAEGARNVVSRSGQSSLRAQIWNEYTKAELLLRKPTGDMDPKTGMKLNTLQKQIEDFERRIEALKLMDNAMIANKKLADPDIITEGCFLIWNMSLPLLKDSMRHHTFKAFQSAAAALEMISSNENTLRVHFHLELAKQEIKQDFLSNAVKQLKKCIDIDYSSTIKAVQVEITPDDDVQDFQRPKDKIIKFLLQKLELKTNLYGGDPQTVQEQAILDVENAKTTRNQKMRETFLDKALKALKEYEEPVFQVPNDEDKPLTEEEITKLKAQFHLQTVKLRKQRVLISSEIAKLAFEELLVDLAYDAATLAIKDTWDPIKNIDLIIAQSEAHLLLAKCYVEYLLEDDIEIGHKNLVTLEDDQDEREFTNEDKEKFAAQKIKFTQHVIQAIKLGSQSRQTWLIFNGAIEFWNNYLPIFKVTTFYNIMLDEGLPVMQEAFEAMNNVFENANFTSENVDYEMTKKMNVFTNLSIIIARTQEFKQKNDEAVRVCDILLTKQLPSNLRKTFESIKARVTKSANAGGAAGGKGAAPPKGGKQEPVSAVEVSKADLISSEVLGYLELIKGGNKDMIQKALDTMTLWRPNETEEIELELNAELWCRLGRVSIDQNTNAFTKIALFCAEQTILMGDKKIKNRSYMQIPVTRLRWYSISECLYGETLFKLLDTKKQEKESQDKLLHASVAHFVESCNIASKAGLGYLLLESCKNMWNALLGLLDAPNNRKLLIKPLSNAHTYLKDIAEASDPDFLTLLYSALFMCIQEAKDWKLGEKIVEEAFLYVPSTHQKVLWEAKMNFLSKLGKNVLAAISNMKESNASLMAKVWVKLARSSAQELEQHSAYNKAIEILRKEESVEVVEVLIEYAEWMQRKKYSSQDVEDQLLLAVDILMDIEPGWDNDEDEEDDADDDQKTRKTGKSKSSRVSKQSKAKTRASKAGKSVKKSMGGAQSRVSNASKRSKSMKSGVKSSSKKTKTALSQRMEEDGSPSFLSCQHFEKLVRIHSMLAMTAHDSTKQREYALDAHFFIMKMWEQSFQCLNATLFFDQHKNQIEELGFSAEDKDSRLQYFQEVITNPEMNIPVVFNIPEKPEDWAFFTLPEQFLQKIKVHEDKIMISKFAFMKPQLTFFHLNNIYKLLEEHLLNVQQLPVLYLLELFMVEVIPDKILLETFILMRARLLMNLGLKKNAEKLLDEKHKQENRYELTEEERKVNLEKIKALRDPNDNMKSTIVPFNEVNDQDPFVLEQIRIHESWLLLAEEHIKWGAFVKAKDLLKEVNMHSRILKDQSNYAKSLLFLSSVAYIEGESGSALKLDMLAQQYTQSVDQMFQSILHTYKLLSEFNKLDDCKTLLDGSIEMLDQMKLGGLPSDQGTKKSQFGQSAANLQHNLPVDYSLLMCYILKGIVLIQEAKQQQQMQEQENLIRASFDQLDKFDAKFNIYGCNSLHLIQLFKYATILQSQITSSIKQVSLKSVEFTQYKLERCAKILLKIQETLTDHMYYIGIHQDSNLGILSLPLMRLLGSVKVRLAQINTEIGVIKNQIKQGIPVPQGIKGGQNPVESTVLVQQAVNEIKDVLDEKKKLDKVLATFMDAITKQIEAQANTYNKEMNRYEKSITMLNSALNMLHRDCPEHAECLIEIARCRRLLAVNKKHLRGQWRQDAIEVDEVQLNKALVGGAGKDRTDLLGEKGLDGEVVDLFVDYKEEALRSFVDFLNYKVPLEEKKDSQDQPPATNAPPGKGAPVVNKDAQPAEADDKQKYSLPYSQILSQIGSSRIENFLATFSIEFAETRGNLNPEQTFYYLSLYQYAISRQNLLKIYQKATNEKHPDVQRTRQLNQINSEFSLFNTPNLPPNYHKLFKQIQEQSKPFTIINQNFTLEDLKENLPHSSGYLIMQLSDDDLFLYCAFMQIKSDRQIQYISTKLSLPAENRDILFKMVSTLAQNKMTMQKAPITIEEDLINLEKDSNDEMMKLLEQMEAFFQPISTFLDPYINPQNEDGQDGAGAKAGLKPNDPKKDDKKAPPAKAAPPKGAPAGKGAEIILAQYESNLPLTSGGFESIVLFLDSKIEALPLENLKIFDQVPVMARDFSLHMYLQRLKSLGHQADLHNNRGISKESMSYIVDPPLSLKQQTQDFIEKELPRLSIGQNWKGVLTTRDHTPSSGEWQEKIGKSSLFAYFSMTCLLHRFTPNMIAELSIFSQCRAMIIFDRMNSFKTLVDRTVATSKHFIPSDQPYQESALFSLCGVNTIVTNHWATNPENNLEHFQNFLRGSLLDGVYLGHSMKKYWNQLTIDHQDIDPNEKQYLEYLKNTRTLFRINSVTYGVPLVRIV